jgi:hypothetical protein
VQLHLITAKEKVTYSQCGKARSNPKLPRKAHDALDRCFEEKILLLRRKKRNLSSTALTCESGMKKKSLSAANSLTSLHLFVLW